MARCKYSQVNLFVRGAELIALTPRGFGAHVSELKEEQALALAAQWQCELLLLLLQVQAKAFAIQGLEAFHAIAGGHWEKGLQLITKAGLLELKI